MTAETIVLSVESLLLSGTTTALVRRKRSKRGIHSPKPKSEWRVKVGQATSLSRYGYFYDYDREGDPAADEVAIRIVKGREHFTIGTLKVHTEDFDRKLQELITKGEERATTLNATAEELG